jgi:hypothetical protein
MSQFILTIDLTSHTHKHSPRAHRHLIGQSLDAVKQRVGNTEDIRIYSDQPSKWHFGFILETGRPVPHRSLR